MEKQKEYTYWLKALQGADEVQARRFAGAMALEIGWGGISQVEKLTGMSPATIRKGIEELHAKDKLEQPSRLRKIGAGRKKVEDKDETLLADLEKILDENTAGDPMSALKWTNKSTRTLAEELKQEGHQVESRTVSRLLKENGYSLQANMKSYEGASVVERDSQFRHINRQIHQLQEQNDPVISVDTKKKELIGNFKNSGKTWLPSGSPKEVNAYDFLSLASGIAIPYGVYDLSKNQGLVNLGVSHDTSQFAVESIRQWWNLFGKYAYPEAKQLMICADGGGSNGTRNRGWKLHLQELANQLQISIKVCHYPPGTSKWNHIEHRMFSFITLNWRGRPLASYETVINLIGATKTRNDLRIAARLDIGQYPTGKKISDQEMQQLNLKPHSLYPKWNYTILPREAA